VQNKVDAQDTVLKDHLLSVMEKIFDQTEVFRIPENTILPSTPLVEKQDILRDLEAQLKLARKGDEAYKKLDLFAHNFVLLIAPYLPKKIEDDDISFPISFFDAVDDPHEVIWTFYVWFFLPEFIELEEFRTLRKVLRKNMVTTANLYGGKDDHIQPHELKDQLSPPEIMQHYFRGTPFSEIFNFPVRLSLPTSERFKHQYVLGKTGSGKSVLLRGQIAQDIAEGRGVVVITPESGLISDALSYVPKEREKDVVYFDPSTSDLPLVGFNPFDVEATGDQLTQKAGELEMILLRSLGELGIKMRPIFSNTVYALLETGGNFADIPKILDPHDSEYRKSILPRLDERTREFFIKYEDSRYYKEAYEPIINRLDALLRAPLLHTLGTGTLDFPSILNKKSSIVLCSLSSLRGFQAEIVGQLLLATFQQTFFQRDYIPEEKRLPYFFYMDEFQTYATSNESSLKDFLTRARKYKTGIVMAHQNTKDIPPGLLSSIFGNCGTLMGMLMSAEDAKRFATESQLNGNDPKAYRQLQNFVAGQVAMTTPENKKAIILRVPEFPPGLERRVQKDIDAMIVQAKQAHGVTELSRKREASPTEETHEPQETQETHKEPVMHDAPDDDLPFHVN